MFRPSRLLSFLVLAASVIGLAGCGTAYDEMYSPRRSRFVPDKPKPKISTLPLEVGPAPAGDTTPSQPIPSSSLPGTAPTPPPPVVPGLEPAPPAPLPGAPPPEGTPAPPTPEAPGTPPAPAGTPPGTPPSPVPGQ